MLIATMNLPAPRMLAITLLGCRLCSGAVKVEENETGMILENDRVRVVVLAVKDGGVPERRFFARSGTEWTLVAEGFRPDYGKAEAGAVALWDVRQNGHRHLVTSLPGKMRALPGTGDGEGAIEVRSEHHGASITETMRLRSGEDRVHIEVSAQLAGSPVRLDHLLSAYTFAHEGVPAFVHTPGVKFDDPRAGAGRDQITGDRSFHAPAVILQEGGLFAALVPDLAAINDRRVVSPDARRTMRISRGAFSLPVEDDKYTMPTGLDLNVKSGLTKQAVMTFGVMDAVCGHHIRYVRDERGEAMVRTLTGGKVGYAFDLFLGAAAPAGCGYQRIARHQWERYGQETFTTQAHLAMPFGEYVRLVTRTIFAPIRDAAGKPVNTPAGVMDPPLPGYADNGSWLEWELDGKAVGGFRCAAPFWNDVIHNSAFWNNARDAVGMFYWGRELGDETLVTRARRIIEFSLAAPRNAQGLFSTLYNAGAKKWGIGWTNPPGGAAQLFLRDAPCYEIATLCKTGAHLLDYHLRADRHARIVEYVRPLGDWLLTALDERGTVPSFVTADMVVSPILRDSAQPAAAMWFLAELFNATRDSKYLSGAKRIAGFLERGILPTARWVDFEQYLSCGAKPFSMVRDEWQGQWFRGNLCVIWAAEGFAALHRAEGSARWLADGERCVDYLSFTQCIWQPHYIYTANPFGGFGVDNSDSAPMLDQRQAETVRPFIYFGKALGRQDLLERAVAAARSGCVLIVHPRHTANGIFPHPMFYPVGVSPENIDHEAHPQCPMRTHPCWGEGSAVFTGLAEARRELGGLYVDAAQRMAVGVDGVGIARAEFAGDSIRLVIQSQLASPHLKQPWEHAFTLTARSSGSGGRMFLGAEEREFSAEGKNLLQVLPDGVVRFAK